MVTRDKNGPKLIQAHMISNDCDENSIIFRLFSVNNGETQSFKTFLKPGSAFYFYDNERQARKIKMTIVNVALNLEICCTFGRK